MDVFLYPGEADPRDVRLRDPAGGGGTTVISPSVGEISVVGQVASLTFVLTVAVGAISITGSTPTIADTLDVAPGLVLLAGNSPEIAFGITPADGGTQTEGNPPEIEESAPAAEGGSGGGGGYGPPSWRRKRIDQDINEWVREVYEELSSSQAPEVVREIKEIAKPFVAETAVDWAALSTDAQAIRKMLALYEKQEEEEEDIFLLMQ